MIEGAGKVRVDKWLWAVRLFKTRTQATDACKAGDILMADLHLKASHQVKPGDILTVRKNGIHHIIEIVRLLDKRVGAPVAQECFLDLTPEEELRKFESWFAAKTGKPEFREKGSGRPTKKERRLIDAFKDLDD
ncbi:MAG: RNA-binding S4 domain-containing protein [Saprospiraceae bacterium]|nr:RNA-binding S4 domain-containing protein [Saprospiraceae bacterium]